VTLGPLALALVSASIPDPMSRPLAYLLAAAGVSAVLGVCWWVQSARPGKGWQTVFIVVLLGALFAEMLLDLYGPVRRFWSNDAIWSDTVSSAVVAGLIFMVWTYRAARAAQRRADGLSSIGLGAVVDHLVDVEMALGFLVFERPPVHQKGKHGPLEWLDRDVLADPDQAPEDPRRAPVTCPRPEDWRAHLVDESLRRLMVGMRNWTPLISTSDDGIEFLLRLSGLRQDLMILQACLTPRGDAHALPDAAASRSYEDDPATLLPALLQRLRALTYFAEIASGPRHGKPVLPPPPWQRRNAVLPDWDGTVPAEGPPAPLTTRAPNWLTRLPWLRPPALDVTVHNVMLHHEPRWLAGFSSEWVKLWQAVISEMDEETRRRQAVR
jgi:hypothetical protein